MEHRMVAIVTKPARASAERCPAVDAGHEVDDRVRALSWGVTAELQGVEQCLEFDTLWLWV
jgi:hypothetical protein